VSGAPDRGGGPGWSAARDRGPVRQVNEDRWLVGPLSEGATLYAVADGMGGMTSGETNARIALEGLYSALLDAAEPLSVAAQGQAVPVIRAAHEVALAAANSPPGLEHGGSTLAWAVVRGGAVTIGWVGDSRVGVVGAGELRWLTRDHSLVEKLMAAGQLTPEDARVHPYRNVLLHIVGPKFDDVKAEVVEETCWHGERLLICTDGIHAVMGDAQIAGAITDGIDADGLLAAAIEAGGRDNLAAILVDISP